MAPMHICDSLQVPDSNSIYDTSSFQLDQSDWSIKMNFATICEFAALFEVAAFVSTEGSIFDDSPGFSCLKLFSSCQTFTLK